MQFLASRARQFSFSPLVLRRHFWNTHHKETIHGKMINTFRVYILLHLNAKGAGTYEKERALEKRGLVQPKMVIALLLL